MHRCVLAVVIAAACVLPAAGQVVQRNFPANALRGVLTVLEPPEAVLNGRPARLAPGVRIRAQNNMLVLSGAAAGQKLVVHYTIDPLGLVKDVWVLTPAEMAKTPWPTTPQQAQAWSFDPVAQVWSKP